MWASKSRERPDTAAQKKNKEILKQANARKPVLFDDEAEDNPTWTASMRSSKAKPFIIQEDQNERRR